MTDKQTGGPAFPGFDYISQDGRKNPDGMTLRDYFASKAMQAIMAGRYPIMSEIDAEVQAATAAYIQADAMLKAREK